MLKKSVFKAIVIRVRKWLNFKYSKDKWGFIAKQQIEGDSGWKSTKRILKSRGILENRIPVRDGTRTYTSRVGMRNLIKRLRVIKIEGRGWWWRRSRVLCWHWLRLVEKKAQGNLSKVWSRRETLSVCIFYDLLLHCW